MKPGEFVRLDVSSRLPRIFAATLLLSLYGWSLPLHGHNVVVSRGEVEIDGERLRVQIRLPAADVLHRHDPGRQASDDVLIDEVREAALVLADRLAGAPVVRNESGERLARESFTHEWTGPPGESISAGDLLRSEVWYRYEYRQAPDNRLITLQLEPAHVLPGVHWQVGFRMRINGHESPEVLRLTSKGNVESIELTTVAASTDRATDACRTCEKRGTARFKQVCADIDMTDDRLAVDLWVPLSLLTTWTAVANEDGFLDGSDAGEALDRFKSLASRAITVTVGGRALQPEVSMAEFRPALAPATDGDGRPGEVNIFTGVARCRLTLEGQGGLARATIRWGLFNNAVLTAQARISTSSGCTEHEFSTYAPSWQGM